MIFQFCLIASVKFVFVTDIVDWDKGFFAYFLTRHPAHWKKVGGFAAHRLKMRVKSRHHSKHIFEHIAIDAFVRGYVRYPALKGLFADTS